MKDNDREAPPPDQEPEEGGGTVDGECVLVPEGEYELLGYFCPPVSRNEIEASAMTNATDHGPQRVAMVVHEYTAEHERFEQSVASSGKVVSRHIVDDAVCGISDKGRLEAFLPGTSLRVIASVFSEQGT